MKNNDSTNVSTPLSPLGERGKGERGRHLLLIRFSALGDILMTVPIVEALARQYPDMRITMVSRPFVGSIFQRLPENVHFVGINPRNYSGLTGLGRLYKEISALKPTLVCDLHDVLRTKYLRMRFKMAGIPTSHIVKDRKARKQFLSATVKTQQETSFERYQKAIERILPWPPSNPPTFDSFQNVGGGNSPGDMPNETIGVNLLSRHGETNANTAVSSPYILKRVKSGGIRGGLGIAPFAAHEGKIYPLDKMEKVVKLLSDRGVKVYLFGAGEKEKTLMEEWQQKYEHVESTVGKLPNMAAEMDLIASLDAMLTMDSGNMHLASLTSTPVYSIWGATHPLGGFMGWGQSMERCIQLDLPCRPCSIFGNKPCQFGDYRCMHGIQPEDIVTRILG